MKTLFLIILSTFVSMPSMQEWIDPHSMNTKFKKNLKYSSSINSEAAISKECYKFEEKDSISFIYLKRVISLLIYTANLQPSDPDNYFGGLNFNLPKEDYQFLLQFTKTSDVDETILRKLESILSESVKKSYFEYYSNIALSYNDQIYYALWNKTTATLAVMLLTLVILYKLFKEQFSLGYIFKYLCFIVFVLDFIVVYLQISEEFETYNAQLAAGENCDTSELSWFEYFEYLGGKKKCGKKFVSPLLAFQYQLKTLIVAPLTYLGKGLGGFGREMFVSLPWGVNIILWPIMLIFTCIVLCIVFVRQPIKLNFFHLFKIEFGGDDKKVQNVLTEQMMNKILDAHRPLIENVNVKNGNRSQESQQLENIDRKEKNAPLSSNPQLDDSGSKSDVKQCESSNGFEIIEYKDESEENKTNIINDSAKEKSE